MRRPVGVAFTRAADGDMRSDPEARRRLSERLGLPAAWAETDQVHGSTVHVVDSPGRHGVGDGLVTTTPGLPLAVFTADCLGLVLTGDEVVAVAHAGWRGITAGVIEEVVAVARRFYAGPLTAHLGAAIGPCCYEVGDEVASRFPARRATTTWGTTAVDLAGEAADRLEKLDIGVVTDGQCTACGDGFSHRRDATGDRMAALGWL